MNQGEKTILVVDDDADFVEQMRLQLTALGFSVITADSIPAAHEAVELHTPDLAVLDLMMESYDAGFILAYELKKKLPTLPIVIATAVTAETGMEFDVSSGDDRAWIKADVILPKPVRFEQLKREISRLLKTDVE